MEGKMNMSSVILGKSGIHSPKNGFGALPIQRVSKEYAAMLLRKAYDAGFTFFDTARAYTDSEEKIGDALSDVRDKITIATKTGATDGKTFWEHLETSLKNLRTDYIDLYQFHTPSFCPGQNPAHWHYQPSAGCGGRGGAIGIIRDAAVSILLPRYGKRSGAGQALPGAPSGLYCDERPFWRPFDPF